MHGSPVWMARTDTVREALGALRDTFAGEWPDTAVAYSYKTNRLLPFLRALAAEGALAEVVCDAEYRIAREVVGVAGEDIVVNGPVKPAGLLVRAADDGALVVADGEDDLERALAAGVRRLGVRLAVPGALGAATRFGVPARDVPRLVRRAVAAGAEVESLAVHLVSTDLTAIPDASRPLAGAVRVRWPRPPGDHARAAAALAALAATLAADGMPVATLDLGGGVPPPPATARHAAAIAAALRAGGFRGRLMVEPGRALVAAAVDLVCTVMAVKHLADGRRVVVVDAGTNLVPGAMWTWPRVTAHDRRGATSPAMVAGPLCLNTDVLHPAADLPDLVPGDRLTVHGVGAYQQVQSTQFGDARPAVLARDRGGWTLARPRETLADVLGPEAPEGVAATDLSKGRPE
jgi:diaminopimelate decarboxylase